MGNIPSKPVITNQQWINGVTKLNQTNLTNGVNQNITNLKTAVDGIIDALGGPGGESASDKTLDQSSITAYNPATTYSQGQVVIYNDKYYRAKENNVTGAWNAEKWSQIALSTPVDSALSSDSTNPAQNKVITEELNTKAVLGAFNGGGTGVDYADLANNLIASKGLEVESYFTFEKTGGEQASAIETGNGTLKNLYGKTEKSENQIVFVNRTLTESGVTAKIENGGITLNGTNTSSSRIVINIPLLKSIPNGTYSMNSFNVESSSLMNIDINNENNEYCFYLYGYGNNTRTGVVNNKSTENMYASIIIQSGTTLNNVRLYPMLVQGNTAPTTWSQGYEGLKHTHITGLKSTSSNLANYNTSIDTPNFYIGDVQPNTTYTLTFERSDTSIGYNIYIYDNDETRLQTIATNASGSRSITFTTSNFTTANGAKIFFNDFRRGSSTTNIMLNLGNSALPFAPYEEDTLEVEFEGNGVGTASDEINVEEGKHYQRTKQDNNMGGLNWGGSEGAFYARVTDMKRESQRGTNVICPKYDADTSSSHSFAHIFTENGYLNVIDDTYQDLASFITATTNIPFTYELETPIVTDVEIPKDTIKVWNGGSMEALGTEIPVGTKIFYQKNIKNFIEGLGEATEWDPNAIALEDDISDESLEKRGYYKMSVLSQTFYSTETVSDLANMGALRTFINDINSSGRHCFFDLHNYVTDAYVCIIHMWTANGVNYCFVEDLINHKTYGDYSGYADATTISTYLSSNAMSSLRVIKITDANITMADINTLLGEINTLGDHVMFDVSAITTAMYLTTIFISGSYYRVFDSVTGRAAAGNSTSGLTEKLVDVINSGIVNPTSWKDIQQIVREGNAKNVFSPGDQLDVLYLDGISSESSNQSLTVTVNADTFINKMGLSASSYIFTYSSTLNSWTLHEGAVSLSTYGVTVTGTPADGNTITVTTTTRTVVFDIVAFDKDVPADSTYMHSMTIQTHNTVGGVQYGNSQAGFQFPDGLAAGAYCFTIGNYDVTYGGNATYYFTLANAIPAGGQLRFDWPYQQQASTRSVYTYASASSGTAIESKPVSTTEISGAPNIGTLINSTIITKTITDQGGNTVTVKVNNADRMRYGSNNWENSAMRQWCNSAAVAGSVWSPKSDFDRPPSWVNSANGFLYHIDPELLAVCGEVNKITKKNTVSDGGGTVTTTDRAFPVSMGAIGVNGYMDEEPLGQYDYYKALLGGQIADWSTHAELIKKNSAGTAQYWWLRGPNPSIANYVRGVNLSGYVNHYIANYGYQAAPALSII